MRHMQKHLDNRKKLEKLRRLSNLDNKKKLKKYKEKPTKQKDFVKNKKQPQKPTV